MAFSQKEKRAHYNAVAKGEKAVKNPSKFSAERQKDYARGQADARNEAAAIYMSKNSTPEQNAAYRERKAAALTGKCSVCGKPCDPKYKVCYACYKSGATVPTVPAKAAKAPKADKKTEVKTPVLGNSSAPKSGFLSRYMQVKRQNPDALVFFRLGDFYEVLGDDAKTVSKVLDLVLTTRDTVDGRVAMCGVPFHSLEQYLAKLTKRGHKVAIAEN